MPPALSKAGMHRMLHNQTVGLKENTGALLLLLISFGIYKLASQRIQAE